MTIAIVPRQNIQPLKRKPRWIAGWVLLFAISIYPPAYLVSRRNRLCASMPQGSEPLTKNGKGNQIEIWQGRTDRVLTHEDYRQIQHNMTGFFQVLNEWKKQEDKNHDHRKNQLSSSQ